MSSTGSARPPTRWVRERLSRRRWIQPAAAGLCGASSRAQRSAALRTDCRAPVRPAADRSQWQSQLASANHDLFEPRDDYPTPVASRNHLGQKRSTQRSATTSKARRPTTDSCAVRRGWPPPTSSTRRSCPQPLTTTPARNRFSSGHVRGGFDRSWVGHSREPHHG